MSDPFIVKTSEFEGPLEVLVSLIEKRKLLINDISLADVTESYLAYLNSLPHKPIDNIADFIGVASTLLLVKSKSLLPKLDLSYEEELSIDDLKERLSRYEAVRKRATLIQHLWGNRKILPAQERPIHISFSPGSHTHTVSIHEAIQRVLERLPQKKMLPENRVRRVVSLEEVVLTLRKRIQGYFRLSFKEFLGNTQDRVIVIVNFLAMLELVKQGEIHAYQGTHFSEIEIESTQIGTPAYF